MEPAEFSDTDAGRVEQGNLRFMFDIGKGINEQADFFHGEESREILIVISWHRPFTGGARIALQKIEKDVYSYSWEALRK